MMTTKLSRYTFSLFLLLAVSWTISCSGRPEKKRSAEPANVELIPGEAAVKLFKIVSPDENAGFKLGDQIKVVLSLVYKDQQPDSLLIYFDGKSAAKLLSGALEYTIPELFTSTTGRKSLKITAYNKGKQQNTITRFMIIYSDVVPKKNGYKVVHSYPHSRDAFTQGLVYDKGAIYEGTGQETESSLREVELETGKVKRQLNIESSLFGEGIALLNDRIFQITWRNKVGFVYDNSTFKQINKIYYSTEGWGMTTIDDRIVLSDGTNILYYYEPEMFTVTSRIEVYDNVQKVDSLNELEYINGEIWANIWMNNHIARIDPSTGKVIAYINLQGLLPESERNGDTDVLNGIAYDKENKRIFVTGKKWPKLYEIKITE